MGTIFPRRKIKLLWVVDPTRADDQRYANVDLTVGITEEICRAEADRLGMTFLVIRQLAHETRNVYRNGRTIEQSPGMIRRVGKEKMSSKGGRFPLQSLGGQEQARLPARTVHQAYGYRDSKERPNRQEGYGHAQGKAWNRQGYGTEAGKV